MRASLALLTLPLLALSSASSAYSPVDTYARLGKWVHVDGPRVRADKVLSDSRCPENARCIWAGEVKLAVTVKGGRWTKPLTLTLGKPMQVADGTLTLTEVLPGRRTDRTIRPSDYRFRFRFDGGL